MLMAYENKSTKSEYYHYYNIVPCLHHYNHDSMLLSSTLKRPATVTEPVHTRCSIDGPTGHTTQRAFFRGLSNQLELGVLTGHYVTDRGNLGSLSSRTTSSLPQ